MSRPQTALEGGLAVFGEINLRPANNSRAGLLEALVRNTFQTMTAESLDAQVKKILDLDRTSTQVKIDPISEMAFKSLAHDDQEDFAKFHDDMDKKEKKRKFFDYKEEFYTAN